MQVQASHERMTALVSRVAVFGSLSLRVSVFEGGTDPVSSLPIPANPGPAGLGPVAQ